MTSRSFRPVLGLCQAGVILVLGALLFARPTETMAQEATASSQILIVYLAREGDPAYAEIASDDGVFRAPLPEPYPGAELALRDTRATAHAIGVTVKLERRVLSAEDDAAAGARQAVDGGAAAIIADLPADDFASVTKAIPASAAPVFNIRHASDALRRDLCSTGAFHVIPSTSMGTDALAQFVVRKNWRRVLVLRGPLPADTLLADAFEASAKKFGARIVGVKAFIFGHDPRRRDETNVAIMTASDDYDVLFLADSLGDFGRFVPYDQVRPRPVIGTEGLQSSAWDTDAERYGAPQLNHRFERSAHRRMTDFDWAAWVAVRAVVEAAARSKARTGPAVEAALARDELPIDVSKGIEGSFRPWDHQFRQSIMLHSGDAVIDYAPLAGFLHQRTPLDTLGVDAGEAACKPALP